MGNSSWNASVYRSASVNYSAKSREELFSANVKSEFDPKNIVLRESCDSEANPVSTPIIIGLDVTGSMGFIAEHIAKKGLGRLVEGVLDDRPVTDPHFMMMAVGDVFCDRSPLQATQFEADIRIAEQLVSLYLEGGGGGNNFESYDLPWIFAAKKTKIDSFNKRNVKGYLFTIGDEPPPEKSPTMDMLRTTLGITDQAPLTPTEWLAEASKQYNVFHVIVEEGSYAKRALSQVKGKWAELLGKRAISLDNHVYLPEVINAVIRVSEGEDPEYVINMYQEKEIQNTLRHALFGPTGQ